MSPIIVESKEINPKAHLVVIRGDLDFSEYQEVKKDLLGLVKQGKINLVVDLEKVNYIDSSGLGALTSTHLKVSANGGTIYLVSPNPHINNIFEITGLDRVVKIVKTREEALQEIETL